MHGFEHKHVLSLMGVVLDNNIPYIIMPFMDNGSLKAYVSNPNNVRESASTTTVMVPISKNNCVQLLLMWFYCRPSQ